MMEASFDAGRGALAAIGGAYQYDTGQRLRMHGLPGPKELAAADEFLSGEAVAVQAQFGYLGDEQSEPRLAQYDAQTGVWLVDVPDAYLTRQEAVNVYVYVMHGADETHSRAKTMYQGCFTPIGRPAPAATVTPDQLNAWDVLVEEVNQTIAKANTAAGGANAAAAQATEAAQAAHTAANAANAAGSAWGNAQAQAQTLAPGSEATVSLGEEAGVKVITFGVPRGEKGEKGDTGPAGVTFTLSGTTLYITTD